MFASSKMKIHQLRLKFRNLPPLWRVAVITSIVVSAVLLYKLLVFIFITDLSYHTGNYNRYEFMQGVLVLTISYYSNELRLKVNQL